MNVMTEITPLNNILFSLVKRGVSVIPIIPGEKRPGEYVQGKWRGMPEWERYAERLPTEIELEHWANWPLLSIGVLTGEVSGVIALDFDNRPEIGEEIAAVIPDSPVKKKGAKGYTSFYKYTGQQNRKWSIGGETVLELLSFGRQTLIPPSVHPTGVEYQWLSTATLSNTETFPELTDEHLEKIEGIIQKYAPRQEVKRNGTTAAIYGSSGKIEDIQKALSVIPAEDYHLWIRIGMALHSHMPGTEGFNIWDGWSRKSAKYSEFEMAQKWNSFHGVTSVNIATLFYEAQHYGYKWEPERKEHNVQVGEELHAPIQSDEDGARDAPEEKHGKLALPVDLINKAPGLVGKIASWINETSIFVQPALALGCSIAAVGALKAHRVRTETNLRTNMYVVGVAPSGGGKGRAMEQVESLLNAAGLVHLFSGEPVSDSALLKSLRNNRGRRLLQWDELGIALQEMTATHAASHKASILSVMMKLFSKASGSYRGKEYADHDDKMKRKDLEQPCLCVYGASTPGTFYKALSSAHVVDGFVARLLVMESGDPYPKRRDIGLTEIPPELISAVQAIEKMPTNDKPQGNLDEAINIRPKIMMLEGFARIAFNEAQEVFDSERTKCGDEIEGLTAVWSRAGEHVMKLALTVEDGDEITTESIIWARDVVLCCTQNLCQVIRTQIADNEYHRALNRVLEMVRKAGKAGISKSNLCRATRSLKSYERNDILENLMEGDQIEAIEKSTGTKPGVFLVAKPTWRR